MRILQIPQVATAELVNESDVYSHLTIMRAIRTLGPMHSYLWARRGDEDAADAFGGDVSLVFDEPPTMRSFYQQMAGVDLYRLIDLFGWQGGSYPIDMVFCSRAGVGPLLQLALGCGNGQYEMPVILTEPRVYGPGEKGHNTVTPTQLAIRAMGYATCFGMYWSRWEKEAALEAAASYVTPAVLDGWDRRAFVVDALVNLPPEKAAARRRSKKVKRLMFVGRLNSNKRWREILDGFGSVYQSREDVEVWVHAGTGAYGKVGEPELHRWHRTSERLTRDAYWDLVQTAHVGAYLSRDEGANVTVQELITAGVAMALPDRPWVRKLFWPLEYPYLASGPNAMKAMVDWLLDHYAEAFAALAPFRELVEKERSWDPFLAKMTLLLEAVQAVKKPPAYRMFRTMAMDALNGRTTIPWATLRMLKPDWKSGAPGFAATRSLMACYASVRDLDDLSGADPMIRRAG